MRRSALARGSRDQGASAMERTRGFSSSGSCARSQSERSQSRSRLPVARRLVARISSVPLVSSFTGMTGDATRTPRSAVSRVARLAKPPKEHASASSRNESSHERRDSPLRAPSRHDNQPEEERHHGFHERRSRATPQELR